MKLYEVEGQLVAMMEAIMDANERGEVVSDDAMSQLADMTLAAADKRDACRGFLQFVESRETEIKADMAVASLQLKAIQNARERMEDYILRTMRQNGLEMVAGNKWKFVVKPGSERVLIANEDMVPDKFVARTERVLDKRVIGAALKAGETVPGATLDRGEPSLAIKPLAAKDRPGETRRIEE